MRGPAERLLNVDEFLAWVEGREGASKHAPAGAARCASDRRSR